MFAWLARDLALLKEVAQAGGEILSYVAALLHRVHAAPAEADAPKPKEAPTPEVEPAPEDAPQQPDDHVPGNHAPDVLHDEAPAHAE